MPQTAPLAVVATPLALTDRRALSEAWYAALRLAGPQHPALLSQGPACAPRRACGRLTAPLAQAHAARNAAAPAAPLPSRTARAGRPSDVPERRAPPSELARRIRRALARRVGHPLPASFAVRVGAGRVHLLVRSDGAGTRIVAVCAASLRTRVERALAQARFALAAHGIRCVRGEDAS